MIVAEKLSELPFSFLERQCVQILPIEVEQIKRDEDAGGLVGFGGWT